jgi:hypothetical protein
LKNITKIDNNSTATISARDQHLLSLFAQSIYNVCDKEGGENGEKYKKRRENQYKLEKVLITNLKYENKN